MQANNRLETKRSRCCDFTTCYLPGSFQALASLRPERLPLLVATTDHRATYEVLPLPLATTILLMIALRLTVFSVVIGNDRRTYYIATSEGFRCR